MATMTELLLEIKEYWSTRKQSLLKNWEFYYGDPQRYYLNRFSGETEEEYQSRVNSAMIENHCAKTCDVLVGYIYGKPTGDSRITVRAVDADGKLIPELQKVLKNNIWRYNKMDSFRIDVALMASVCGYAPVHKEFVDSRTMLPFGVAASSSDKAKYGTIRYDLFDAVDTMPVPRVYNGEIYGRMLGAVVRHYSRDNFSGNSYYDRILNKRYQPEDVLEVYEDETIRRSIYSGEAEIETNMQTQKNKYGNINYLFTIFRNYGDPMYLEGESDLSQIMHLQIALNELLNDDKATIAYHSFPILKITHGGKLPPNFIRKVNSAIELDQEQDASYLTWDNTLEASDKFKESIRLNMTVTSGVSQLSRGNSANVGQVRSGAGLKTLFQADINAVGLKLPYFEDAEKHLAETSLRMYAKETGLKLPEDWMIDVCFAEDFVGLDELLKAQVEQLEVTTGTESLREVIKEKHPEVTSEEEIDAILKQVMDERKKLAQQQAQVKKPESTQAKSNQQST